MTENSVTNTHSAKHRLHITDMHSEYWVTDRHNIVYPSSLQVSTLDNILLEGAGKLPVFSYSNVSWLSVVSFRANSFRDFHHMAHSHRHRPTRSPPQHPRTGFANRAGTCKSKFEAIQIASKSNFRRFYLHTLSCSHDHVFVDVSVYICDIKGHLGQLHAVNSKNSAHKMQFLRRNTCDTAYGGKKDGLGR